MNRRVSSATLLGVLVALQQAAGCASISSADRVLLGPVWTGIPSAPLAGGVAIKDGVVVGVGDETALQRFITPTNTQRVAGLIAPGLIDAHVHPLGAGRQEQGCSLQGAKSPDALRVRIRACHEAMSDPSAILFGRGWDLSLFKNANPHRSFLDDIVGSRPTYFRGEDGHSGWANSAMLERAQVTRDTAAPANGVIERDPDGAPSGTLREDALELVERLLPKPTLANDVKALRWSMGVLAQHGITSIMDAGLDEERLSAYAALHQETGLPVDVVGCLVIDPNGGDAALAAADALRTKFSGIPGLQVRCAKIFLDGVLEGETAALLSPYDDHKDHRGAMATSIEQLKAVVTRLEERGYQVHMHVIGDAAVRAALDAIEAARAVHGDTDLRHTLAHLQLIDAADLARFAKLGVVANAQSLWAYPDTYIVDINTPQVGQARVDRMYPWGSLRRAGARLVGGSDWPVSSVNPLDAMETMVRRQNPAAPDGPVLGTNESLDAQTALAAYTREGAYLLHRDNVGVLRVGADADIVVFDANPLTVDPKDINTIKVVTTLKRGVVTFSASTATTPDAGR